MLGRQRQGITDWGASTPETDFLTVRRLAIGDQGAGEAGSPEASLLGLQTAVLMWFFLLCVCVLLPLLIRTLVLLNWSQDMTLFELNTCMSVTVAGYHQGSGLYYSIDLPELVTCV